MGHCGTSSCTSYFSTIFGGLMFGITTSTPLVLIIAQVESFKKAQSFNYH
jgi:hypothetical protein